MPPLPSLSEPPRAILSEILGVLVEDVWAETAAQLAERTGVNPRTLRSALDARIPAFERSGEDLDAFYREVALRAELPLDMQEFSQVVLDRAVKPVPGNIEAYRRLRAGGAVRLVAVSNIPGPLFDAIDRKYRIASLFDELVLSYREGIAKPNQQVYIEAIDRAGVPPRSILYVDASDEDLGGAREWGLACLKLGSPGELPAALAEYFPPA